MALSKRKRAGNESDWRNAKKLCQRSRRQLEMARSLGMNPRKLPGLRPSTQQRWKIPVGSFIEECYRKRFGGAPESGEIRRPPGEDRFPAGDAMEIACEPMRQVEDLVCYFANLSDDLERWLVHGTIAPEVLVQVRKELREIADALEAGKLIPQMQEISTPPAPRSRRSAHRGWLEHTLDDDEIPF
jgi:hypothetical protein